MCVYLFIYLFMCICLYIYIYNIYIYKNTCTNYTCFHIHLISGLETIYPWSNEYIPFKMNFF